MENDNSSDAKTTKARVILASRTVGGVSMGKVEVLSGTKHGETALIGIKPPAKLEPGEALVTDAWVLGSRNFVVVGEYEKPMKIPGNWYVVRAIKSKS